ncbi:MAG: LamG domain-containing protein [Akkermansiaceae bacterium]|nr:LamG domain-containing protein [Armatimonadota bacterium]
MSDAETGKISGEAKRGTGPGSRGALVLTGKSGSFVEISKPIVDTSRSFSVTACVKLNQLSGHQTVVGIDGKEASGFFLQLREDTGSFGFTMLPDAESGGGNPTTATAEDTPDTDRWYHIAGVYDASKQNISFYLDGILQQTVPFRRSVQATGPTAIGRGKFGTVAQSGSSEFG